MTLSFGIDKKWPANGRSVNLDAESNLLHVAWLNRYFRWFGSSSLALPISVSLSNFVSLKKKCHPLRRNTNAELNACQIQDFAGIMNQARFSRRKSECLVPAEKNSERYTYFFGGLCKIANCNTYETEKWKQRESCKVICLLSRFYIFIFSYKYSRSTTTGEHWHFSFSLSLSRSPFLHFAVDDKILPFDSSVCDGTASLTQALIEVKIYFPLDLFTHLSPRSRETFEWEVEP